MNISSFSKSQIDLYVITVASIFLHSLSVYVYFNLFSPAKEMLNQMEVSVEKEALVLNVSFSAFYRSDLENLNKEAPKINAPPGSQKTTPFTYNEGGE